MTRPLLLAAREFFAGMVSPFVDIARCPPAAVLALGTATVVTALPGCAWLKTPEGKAMEQGLTRLGCALAPVIARAAHASDALGEEVGTLCDDLAPAVEAELAAMVAAAPASPASSLLAHRERHHARRQRLRDHFAGRDPAETIEEGVPLEAALRVLRRRAVDGGGR